MLKLRNRQMMKMGLIGLSVLLIVGISVVGSGILHRPQETEPGSFRYAVSHYENLTSVPKGHRVLVSGSGLNHMSIVDYDGTVLWTVPQSAFQWVELNDADMSPNGDVTMAVRGNEESTVYRIRPDYRKGTGYEILWTYRIPKGSENHTAQALPDGGVLISHAAADRLCLVELDPQGQVRKILGDGSHRLPGFESPAASSHMQVRQVHKTADGTYLIARFDGQKTVELDADGHRVGQYPSVGGFTAVGYPDRSILVSGGDRHDLTCLSQDTHQKLWTIGASDIPGVTLGFTASVQVLENGHIVLANWGGHGGASGDSVMEIDPVRKQVVWSLDVGPAVSNVQVLDEILTDDVLKAASERPVEIASDAFRSPHDLVSSEYRGLVYVADHTNRTIEILRAVNDCPIGEIALLEQPNALALSGNGKVLYVAMGAADGQVEAFDTDQKTSLGSVTVGHMPSALAVSDDGRVLYVANRFSGTVQTVDLDASGKPTAANAPVPVTREPVALAVAAGKLFIGGHLPAGNMQDAHISSEVVVLNLPDLTVEKTLTLANGSTDLKDMALSPDGAYLYITHTLGRYNVATTQADRGWIYNNALSEIRTADATVTATMLLDDVDHGAANPFGVASSQKTLYVGLAGTGELLLIDREKMRSKIDGILDGSACQAGYLENADDIATDLTFLHECKKRIDFGQTGLHGVALVGHQVYVANYYAGNVVSYDSRRNQAHIVTFPTTKKETPERAGERLWNDATIGFQHWQSCASCHPDGRADALNWDNMNDGIGTPKQARTMLDSWYRGRVMATGIRPNARAAVRAGLRYIMFNAEFPESDFACMDAYVQSLTPEVSPYLVNGKLSESAERGKILFNGKAQCAACHNGKLYGQDKLIYANFTQSPLETRGMLVPPLREVWRTAPYLHDGSATTIRDVLTTRNLTGTHGQVGDLSESELDDLCEYVLSIGTIGDGVTPPDHPDETETSANETEAPAGTTAPTTDGETSPLDNPDEPKGKGCRSAVSSFAFVLLAVMMAAETVWKRKKTSGK